jgi:glycosyltransferase involved in cell wall biosynthesis
MRVIYLKVLYYSEPKQEEIRGGVGNVALFLPKALSREVGVIYYPRITSNRYPLKLIDIYKKLIIGDFDIIHFNISPVWINGSYVILKCAKLAQIPTIMNIHAIVQYEHTQDPGVSPLSGYQLRSQLNASGLVDRIVVNSEYMKKIVPIYYGVRRDKVIVIPNGINIEDFSNRNSKQKLDGEPAIINIGRFSFLKGTPTLIEAVAKVRTKLPTAKLHIIGKVAPEYLQLSRSPSVEEYTVFHGEIKEHTNVLRYLKGSDILVSASRHEGFGIVILEAMASGVPVIASNIESFQELISNGTNGLLFPVGNADALSEAIVTLYENRLLRKELVFQGLETAKTYSWTDVASKYISLYQSLHK